MADKPHDKHDEHGGQDAKGGHKHKGGHGHGGGHEDHHEGAPEWLISFADNVALMMGFFVILLALNMAKKTVGGIGGEAEMGLTIPTSDMLDWVIGVREAFNNPVNLESKDPAEQALVRRILQRRGPREARDAGTKGRDQEVLSIRPSDYHSMSGSIIFDEFSSAMSEQAHETVREIAGRIRGLNLIIEVRAHTSAAEAFKQRKLAMRLAYERAAGVASDLAVSGVDWWQMRLVLCADNDRLDKFPNNVEKDRPNARVEVIVTDQVVPPTMPTMSPESEADSRSQTPEATGPGRPRSTGQPSAGGGDFATVTGAPDRP